VLLIAGSLRDWDIPIGMQNLPKEGHQAIEAKQTRRVSFNGGV